MLPVPAVRHAEMPTCFLQFGFSLIPDATMMSARFSCVSLLGEYKSSLFYSLSLKSQPTQSSFSFYCQVFFFPSPSSSACAKGGSAYLASAASAGWPRSWRLTSGRKRPRRCCSAVEPLPRPPWVKASVKDIPNRDQ